MTKRMKYSTAGWIAAALLCGVLSLYRLGVAAPPQREAEPPLRNPIAQREEMIKELQEIKALLKEQNTLLQQVVKSR